MTTAAGLDPALDDLPEAGRIAVIALRGCAASSAAACLVLHDAGLSGRCLGALVALLGLVRAGGRGLDLASPCHPRLTGDELALAAALSALQRGTPWRCQGIVRAWVAPPVVPRALGLLGLVAEELARAGLRLPPVPTAASVH